MRVSAAGIKISAPIAIKNKPIDMPILKPLIFNTHAEGIAITR